LGFPWFRQQWHSTVQHRSIRHWLRGVFSVSGFVLWVITLAFAFFVSICIGIGIFLGCFPSLPLRHCGHPGCSVLPRQHASKPSHVLHGWSQHRARLSGSSSATNDSRRRATPPPAI
jgi:hypothetical protein